MSTPIYYEDATTLAKSGEDVTKRISDFEPWNTPLQKVLSVIGSERAFGPKFEWGYSAEQIPYITLDMGGDLDGTTTTAVFDSTTGIHVGDTLEEFGSTNGEQMKVATVTNSTTLELTRSINGATGDTHADNAVFYIIGSVHQQGGTPAEESFTPTDAYNYVQPISAEMVRTEIEEATVHRTDLQAFNDRQILAEYKKDRERAFLYQDRYTDGTNHYFYTGGLKYWIDVADAAETDSNIDHTHESTVAALTLTTFRAFQEDLFNCGSSQDKYIFCGSGFMTSLRGLYDTYWQIRSGDALGYTMAQIPNYLGGNLYVIHHPLMKGTYNLPGYWAIGCDIAYLTEKVLLPHRMKEVDFGEYTRAGYRLYSATGLMVRNPFTLVQYNLTAAS